MFNISNTHFSAQFSKHGLAWILSTMEHQLHAQQNEQTPVDSIFLAQNPPN
jgi:hypothetical protein